MSNVLDALAEAGAPLESVVLGTGGKHYGMHLGPGLWAEYSSPFYEGKCPGPLSYFDAVRFLQRRAGWTDSPGMKFDPHSSSVPVPN